MQFENFAVIIGIAVIVILGLLPKGEETSYDHDFDDDTSVDFGADDFDD